MAIIPPGSTIGILGGGQLGRMTAMAARTMGYSVHVLDPDAEPVSDAYARLSPDGAGHWPILLGRLKPMWTVAVSAMTMTLSVAVMAMVRFSLLTWMVGACAKAGAAVASAAAMRATTGRGRIFIGLLL